MNCSGSDALARWSVIIAGLALAVALGALYIGTREHVVFVKQLTARARFNLNVDIARVARQSAEPGEPAGGDVIEVAADRAWITFRVALRNVGDKAAGETHVNVLVPEPIAESGDFYWCNEDGDREPDSFRFMSTSDTLKMASGDEVTASWITKSRSRIPLRTPMLMWFRLVVLVPDEVPVRVAAQSDDLPDDQEQAVCARTFRVSRFEER